MEAVRSIDPSSQGNQREEDRYSVQLTRGGKPVPGDESDRLSISIEEDVMEWRNASHIHGWFVDNVQNGKDDHQRHQVTEWKLRELLSVCEKVLNASQLVREPVFNPKDHDAIRRRVNAASKSPKVIRNVSMAVRLLPVRGGYRDLSPEYGEAYLKDVEATRDWAERMLMDIDRGLRCTIYYSASGW